MSTPINVKFGSRERTYGWLCDAEFL